MLSESPDPTRIDQYAPCPEEPRRQAQALAPPAAGLCTGPVAGGLSVGTLSARTSGRRPGFRVCYLPTVRWLEPSSYPECSAAGELGLFLQPERLHSSSGPRNDVQLSAVDVLRIRPPGMARVHVGVRRCGGSTTALCGGERVAGESPPAPPRAPGEFRKNTKNMAAGMADPVRTGAGPRSLPLLGSDLARRPPGTGDDVRHACPQARIDGWKTPG